MTPAEKRLLASTLAALRLLRRMMDEQASLCAGYGLPHDIKTTLARLDAAMTVLRARLDVDPDDADLQFRPGDRACPMRDSFPLSPAAVRGAWIGGSGRHPRRRADLSGPRRVRPNSTPPQSWGTGGVG